MLTHYITRHLFKCPKLIIHSPEDEIIPFEHGKSLYKRASQPKDFLEIKDGHNEGFFISGNIYIDGLKRFLYKYLSLNSIKNLKVKD